MALTFNNFWGAEGGDLNEAHATSNASASSVQKRTGGFSFTFSSSSAGWILFKAFKGNIADAGNGYFVEFASYIPDVTPATDSILLNIFDSAATASQCSLVINGSGEIVLFDSAGSPTTLATSPGLIANTWTKFAFYFENLASGDCEIFVDGVSKGSLTGKNLKNGSTVFDIIGLYSVGAASGCYQDDIAVYSGAVDSGDLPEVGECRAYWSTLNSATGDAGGALASGTWDLLQHTPFETTVQAQYDTTGAGSVDTNDSGGSEGTGGPNTDTNITEDPLAIKGLWRLERGTGGATAHHGLLGNNVDGTTRSIDFNPPQTPANFEMVSVAASIVPTKGQYCRIGIETTGAQNFECYGMLATVWHIPSAGNPPLEAAVGSYVLSGVAAGLHTTRRLAAATGAFTQTGVAAGLHKTFNLKASTGAFTQTGIAALLKRSRVLIATTGAFTQTGVAAGLHTTRRLAAATGAFIQTGLAVDLILGNNLQADVGSYVLSGQAAGLKRAVILKAGQGSFVQTGVAAGLNVTRRLAADTGAFIQTGQVAGLKVQHRLPATTGAYTQSGISARLAKASVLKTAAGAFNYSGIATGLTRAKRLQAATGSFVVTGIAATLEHVALPSGSTLAAEVGVFLSTGAAARFIAPGQIEDRHTVRVADGLILAQIEDKPNSVLLPDGTIRAKL